MTVIIFFSLFLTSQAETLGAPETPPLSPKAERPLPPGWSQGVSCEAQKRILGILDRTRISRQEYFEGAMSGDKPFLLVGDTHMLWEENEYIELMKHRNRTNPDGNCLFLEKDDAAYQSLINKCMNNPESMEASIDQLKCGSTSDNVIWNRTIAGAIRNGWKVFAVDEYDGCDKVVKGNAREVCRNSHMTRRIKEHPECKSGMVIVGTKHLDPAGVGGTQTVPGMLANNGRAPGRIVKYDHSYQGRLNRTCGDNLGAYAGYYGRIDPSLLAGQPAEVTDFFSVFWIHQGNFVATKPH